MAVGAVGGAAGSIVSQGLGIAIGQQSSFNWGQVGLAAIGGAVGGGISESGTFDNVFKSGFLDDVAQGVGTNVLTQGIDVATGLQHGFSWAGIAQAGVSAGLASALPNGAPTSLRGIGNSLISGLSGGFAGAATTSLLSHTDFGSNLLNSIPNAIGQTIGNAVASEIANSNGPRQPTNLLPPGYDMGSTPVGATVTPIPGVNYWEPDRPDDDNVTGGAGSSNASMTLASYSPGDTLDIREAALPLKIPVAGLIGYHHLVVLFDESTNSELAEIDGLATNSSGKVDPVGSFPIDKLKYYLIVHDDSTTFPTSAEDGKPIGGYYRPDEPQSVLVSGSEDTVMTYWNAGTAAIGPINNLNLNYPPLGVNPSTWDINVINSNSIATTELAVMNLSEPSQLPGQKTLQSFFGTPGQGNIILSNNQIERIQQTSGLYQYLVKHTH